MYELKLVWRHSTLITPSPTAHRQSITASVKKLPDTVVKLTAELAVGRVDMSGETIRLSISLMLVADFAHVMCIKYKQMLALNFILISCR